MKNKIMLHDFVRVMLLLVLVVCLTPSVKAGAEEASAISIGIIDYDKLTMQIYNNNNSVVFYSLDQSAWTEVEGAYNSTTESYTMDISWVSAKSDVTLYFKGGTIKTIKSVTLPMMNSSLKVLFDKAEGEFTFTNAEDSDNFEWRKASDYHWTTVSLDEASVSYQTFLYSIELLRTKGAKLLFRTSQVLGTSMNDVGARPSKEVTVTISARAAAPSIKVNTSKLTLNTTASMEYYDERTSLWMECTGTMSLEDVAPAVLFENGANSITLMVRRAATTTDTFSKTAFVTIPGQTGAPVIGGISAEVTYYYMNSKLVLQFNKASASNIYEYAIVKSDVDFTEATARWMSITTSKTMTISSSTAPEGCTIYIRRKGTDVSVTKNTALVLPSAVCNFTVRY
jgi:hypothetical protein